MKKILSVILLLTSLGLASSIASISPGIKNRMIKGGSWRPGCPVSPRDLRYLRLDYMDFQGRHQVGEMIVHRTVSAEVKQIFDRLYHSKYPIRQMKLVSDYHASDFRSIEADNTSAFNCRAVTGGKKWSNHSYGKAIDINPIENPYVSRSGRISHNASLKYRRRARGRAVMLKKSSIVKLFKAKGWRWGGDWHSVKDYQHFDKPVRHRSSATPAKRHPRKSRTTKKRDIPGLF